MLFSTHDTSLYQNRPEIASDTVSRMDRKQTCFTFRRAISFFKSHSLTEIKTINCLLESELRRKYKNTALSGTYSISIIRVCEDALAPNHSAHQTMQINLVHCRSDTQFNLLLGSRMLFKNIILLGILPQTWLEVSGSTTNDFTYECLQESCNSQIYFRTST